MSTINDRLDADFAPTWRPQLGEKLIGRVVSITERHGDYAPYPVLTVRRDDGSEVALHAFHHVAAQKLAEQRAQVGERIGLKYLGKRDGKYHDWRVVVDRDAQPIDWSRYSGDDAPPAGPGGDVPAAPAPVPVPAATRPRASHDDDPRPEPGRPATDDDILF